MCTFTKNIVYFSILPSSPFMEIEGFVQMIDVDIDVLEKGRSRDICLYLVSHMGLNRLGKINAML